MTSKLLDLDQFQRLHPVDGACGYCCGLRHPAGMARRRAFSAAGAALGFASLLPVGA